MSLTNTVTSPRARGTSRARTGAGSGRRDLGSQSGGRAATRSEAEVLCQRGDQLVAHGAEGAEVGDVVLVEGAAGEDCVLAGEEDVYLC